MAIRIPYEAYSFNPPKISKQMYDEVKAEEFSNFISKIKEKNNFEKDMYILSKGGNFTYYLLYIGSWIVIFAFLLLIIFTSLYGWPKTGFIKIILTILAYISGIGVFLFLGSISYRKSFHSFLWYLWEKKSWFKKLKKNIDRTSSYEEFKKIKVLT